MMAFGHLVDGHKIDFFGVCKEYFRKKETGFFIYRKK